VQTFAGLVLAVAGLLGDLPAGLAEQVPGLTSSLVPDLTGLLGGGAGHSSPRLGCCAADLARLVPGHVCCRGSVWITRGSGIAACLLGHVSQLPASVAANHEFATYDGNTPISQQNDQMQALEALLEDRRCFMGSMC